MPEGGAVPLPEALPEPYRPFFAVGRLDRDSEGLLLLCDDSRTAQRLMDPGGVSKTYLVTVEGFPSDEDLGPMRSGGTVLDGHPLLPAAVERVGKAPRGGTRLRVVLHEGRNRQIRRQLRLAGFKVRRLVREAVGPVALGPLAPGEARELGPAEVEALLGGPGAPASRAVSLSGPRG